MKEKEIKENYKYLFDMVLHESKFAWETGSVFLLVNTVLAGFLGTNLKTFLESTQTQDQWFLLMAPFLGIAISILWFFSLKRIQIRQGYWIAREYEAYKENWLMPIFSGDAKTLADGGIVKADGERFDLKIFGIINLPSQKALAFVIILFLLFYISIIAMSLDWF